MPALGQVSQQALLAPEGWIDRPLGEADAPVTLIVYSSPTCGHCADFHHDVLPLIEREYVETGKIRLLFRPLIRNAIDAAVFMLAEGSGAVDYLDAVTSFYERHDQLVTSSDPRAVLADEAEKLGVNAQRFEALLVARDQFERLNRLRDQAVSRFGVTGTPAFFVNGRKVEGAQSFDELAGYIDDELSP